MSVNGMIRDRIGLPDYSQFVSLFDLMPIHASWSSMLEALLTQSSRGYPL